MKSTVLVVDDNDDTRSLLQFALEQEGYAVSTVSGGASALRFLENIQPDLIVTDLMMPEVSGLDFIKKARRNPQYSNTPIIILSAFSQGYYNEAKEAGATMVLDKPVDVLSLPEIVGQLLTSVHASPSNNW